MITDQGWRFLDERLATLRKEVETQIRLDLDRARDDLESALTEAAVALRDVGLHEAAGQVELVQDTCVETLTQTSQGLRR